MRFLALLFILISLGCDTLADDDERSDRVFTDAHINAPIVPCDRALPGWNYKSYPSPPDRRFIDVDFTDAQHGIVVGDRGLIARTTDGGQHWEELVPELTDATLGTLQRVTPELLYASGSLEGGGGSAATRSAAILLRSEDGGEQWTKSYLDSFISVADLRFTNREEGLALLYERVDSFDYRPGLYRTNDAGSSWQQIDYPQEVLAIEFATIGGQLAIVGYDGIAVASEDLQQWELRRFPDDHFGDFLFDGVSTGLIAKLTTPGTSSSPNHEFYRTTDAGQNWTNIGESLLDPYRFKGYLSPDGTGVVIDGRGEIIGGDVRFPIGSLYYATEDGGLTWTVRKTDSDCGFGRTLFEIVPGHLLSVGMETVVLHR